MRRRIHVCHMRRRIHMCHRRQGLEWHLRYAPVSYEEEDTCTSVRRNLEYRQRALVLR
jgi:hypothetical protein